MNQPIAHFEELLKTVPKRLVDLADDAVSHKPAPNRWSKKEILGHLIDSAANNHQRFVRAQSTPRPSHPTTLRNWYYPERMPVSRRAFLGAVPAALAAQSAAPAAINRRDVVSRHNPCLLY